MLCGFVERLLLLSSFHSYCNRVASFLRRLHPLPHYHKSRGSGLSGHPQMEHTFAWPAGQGRASICLSPVSCVCDKIRKKRFAHHPVPGYRQSPRGNRSGNVMQLVTPRPQAGAERERMSSVRASQRSARLLFTQSGAQSNSGWIFLL